jgi:sporulation protein YlmC with PRC-barrel domain
MVDRKVAGDIGGEVVVRRAQDMLGYSIQATDGEVGFVGDLVIDDEHFKLRYLVIDTGRWLSGRRVVLATPWISSVHPERKTVVVNIEKKRIADSPTYDQSVFDRNYERALHEHYGFPYASPV